MTWTYWHWKMINNSVLNVCAVLNISVSVRTQHNGVCRNIFQLSLLLHGLTVFLHLQLFTSVSLHILTVVLHSHVSLSGPVKAKCWSPLPAGLTVWIQRNANSLQPDPLSLQCYPNRAAQPSWNQHHECFHHSYWDISIFIVRNHPYFTSSSPAAPITLEQHIRLILGPVSTQCFSLKEDTQRRLTWCHWRRHTGRIINLDVQHFPFLTTFQQLWRRTAKVQITFDPILSIIYQLRPMVRPTCKADL